MEIIQSLSFIQKVERFFYDKTISSNMYAQKINGIGLKIPSKLKFEAL